MTFSLNVIPQKSDLIFFWQNQQQNFDRKIKLRFNKKNGVGLLATFGKLDQKTDVLAYQKSELLDHKTVTAPKACTIKLIMTVIY